MREIYTFEANRLYYSDKDDYENFISNNDCWCTSFLLCAKNPFHTQIVNYRGSLPKDHPEYLYAYRPLQHLMVLNMIDSDSYKFFSGEMIDKALIFINDELTKGNDVIAVCNKGMSRSPTICLMYLMAHGDIPYEYSFEKIVLDYLKIAPEWNPNKGIIDYCERFWNKTRSKYIK